MLGLRRNIITGGIHKEIITGVFSLISSVGPGSGANGSTTAAIDTTGAKLIVLSLHGYAPSPTATVSDNQGNVYEPLFLKVDATNAVYEQLFYCINPVTSVAHTFAAAGAASYSGVYAQAFGATLTPVYTGRNTSNETFSNNFMNAGNIAGPNLNTLFVTGICVLNTSIATPYTLDLGYTVTGSQAYSAGNNLSSAAGYKIQPAKGANNPLWQWNNGIQSTCSHASFICI